MNSSPPLSSKKKTSDISSLLLATCSCILLALARDDFPEHDNTIPVHEGNPGETFTVLESVAHERLLWLEAALRHLIRLERMRILHLLSSCFLSHFPFQLGNAACRATTPDEADWRVANLDFIGDVQDLDLGIELARLTQSGVLLVDHDVARSRHVVLVQALNVQANVIARIRKVHPLMVHLDCEHLASAGIGSSVRGQKHNLFARLHHTLLHTAGQDIANTFDFVDTGNWHPHRCTHRPLRHAAQLVEHIVNCIDMDGLLSVLDILSLPPPHVVRLLQQIVAHPAGDGHHWRVLLNEFLLPANLDKHTLHLICNFIVA